MKRILLILGILVVVCLFLTACVPPQPAGETKVFTDDDDADEMDDVDEVDDVDDADEDEADDDEEEVEEIEEDVETQVIVSEDGSVSQEDLDELRENLNSMDIEDLGGLSD
ncbi:MAG: hypothetical protein ABIG93_00305 [archaeon]|nr:hypothetical protein [Nanoarchaeota archaeon]